MKSDHVCLIVALDVKVVLSWFNLLLCTIHIHTQSNTTELRGTATELGRDPDMRRNVPKPPLLNPLPKVRQKKNRPAENSMPTTKRKCTLYII